MGDLQHIFLAETLRFGILKNGMGKYISPYFFYCRFTYHHTFYALSSNRFFIFTPASFIKKFGSFYGEVNEMTIELENSYNHIELDGDIVTIEENILAYKTCWNYRYCYTMMHYPPLYRLILCFYRSFSFIQCCICSSYRNLYVPVLLMIDQ